MTSTSEQYDDHYWDVIAQRQLGNVVNWLRDFIDRQFRKRVWQEGTGVGQYYEESACQFLDDIPIEWLVDEGLARLNAPAPIIDALRSFYRNYSAFDRRLPNWVDAARLESDPIFGEIVAEAQRVVSTIEHFRTELRKIDDDL